jgi:Fe-S-cluster containining protein
MQLDVLPSPQPWYAEGLKFTCTQCGNCCTGGPGFVWISMEEVDRLAEFLKINSQQVLSKYCRKIGGRISLKERRMPNGNYDCVFLQEIERPKSKQTQELAPGQRMPQAHRGCAIYSVRPLQCRTWPFWESNLSNRKMWDLASKKCPGMGRGSRKFARQQIEALRDAQDWPEDPPTSSRRS